MRAMVGVLVLAGLLSGCYHLAATSSLSEAVEPWQPPGRAPVPGQREARGFDPISPMVGSPAAGTAPDADAGRTVCAVLAGDSWAFFDTIYAATSTKVRETFPTCTVKGSYRTTDDAATAIEVPLVLPGTRAAQWAAPENSDFLVKALRHHREARLLILYLGGNDFIADYHRSMTPAQVAALAEGIRDQVAAVIRNVRAGVTNRELRFLLVGYTYFNLSPEALEAEANRLRREHMGNPTAAQLNTAFAQFADTMQAFAEATPGVFYARNLQRFSQRPERGTPAERMVNVAVEYGTNREWVFVDSIHLGRNAQHRLAEGTVQTIVDENLITP